MLPRDYMGTVGTRIWIGGLENSPIFVGLVGTLARFVQKQATWAGCGHNPFHPVRPPLVKTSSNDAHHGVQNGVTTLWGAGCHAIPKGSIAANAPIELIQPLGMAR